MSRHPGDLHIVQLKSLKPSLSITPLLGVLIIPIDCCSVRLELEFRLRFGLGCTWSSRVYNQKQDNGASPGSDRVARRSLVVMGGMASLVA